VRVFQDRVNITEPSEAAMNLERLRAAVRYGWAMEEIVWRLAHWGTQLPLLSDKSVTDDFPAAMPHELSPATHVRVTRARLRADRSLVPGYKLWLSDNDDVDSQLAALLRDFENGGDVGQYFMRAMPIVRSVGSRDAMTLEALADSSPARLAAYVIGKSLSKTLWELRVAALAGLASGAVADAWRRAFDADRIDEIQRQPAHLTSSMQQATVAGVQISLRLWLRAYEQGHLAGLGRANWPSEMKWSGMIPEDRERRQTLIASLELQLANWYDLLTGRRQLESFPVTSLVAQSVGA
jgi:hypothetical protein